MFDCGRSKAFAPLRGASYFDQPIRLLKGSSLLVQRKGSQKKRFSNSRMAGQHGPDASRCGCAASVPCAPRVSRGRRTTRFAQTRAPLRPSTHCGARLALRPLEVRSQEQKHNHGNGSKVMLIDCSRKRQSSGSCFCLSESPSAATEPVGKTRRAACMDARRFSTRQGGRVEKSRRRSGPDALARRARRQGRVFSWLLLFARAKRSNSLPGEERKPLLQKRRPR